MVDILKQIVVSLTALVMTLSGQVGNLTQSVSPTSQLAQVSGTVTPPTFVQEAETVWNTSTSPKTTASFNVQTGDVLVAYAANEDYSSALGISGGSLTWTLQQRIAVSQYTEVDVWTAVVDVNKSMTVSFSDSTGKYFGGDVLTFRGSDGVGASAKINGNGAPSLNLTTTANNSAIVVANGDWSALTGSTAWSTNAGSFNELTNYSDGSHYGAHGGYYSNVGSAGTYAVGMTAPTGQKYAIAAVEVKGTGGTPPPPPALTSPSISSFSSSPSSITSGQSSTLSWSVSGNPAPTFSISNIGTVTGSSVSVSPTQTTSYTLTATNSQGSATANTSVTVTATPPSDTTAPSIPTNLSATAVSSSGINLSWTASTDNTAVTGYNIYRAGTKIGTSATNSYSDTGLTASTNYSYTVSAYDAAGNTSSQSTSASATTQAASSGSGHVFFVRPGASGNGSSWASAWGNLNNISWSSLSSGDVVCIAGGSYSGSITTGKSGSAGSPITLKRAIASDANCGSTTSGWSSSYDAQVVMTGTIALQNNYITIDGMVPNGISLVIGNPSGSYWVGIGTDSATANITLRYIEMAGPCANGQGCVQNGDNRAIQLESWNGSNWNTQSNWLIQYANIHGACNNMVIYGAQNLIVEHSRFADSNTTGNTVNCHPNIVNAGSNNNVTWRYNEMVNWQVEGIMLLGGNGTWNIYGNLWHDPMSGSYPRIVEVQDSVEGPVIFYNNTVANVSYSCAGTANGGSFASGTKGADNLYFNSGSSCGLPSETNSYSGSANTFVNSASQNYHLKAALPGLALASPYNIDYDGNTRGSDGVWDIGAYEYTGSGGGGDTTAPSVPTNLSATAVSSSGINLSWTASTDNVAVTGYNIYRGGTKIGTSATNSYSDTGLTASTAYTYTVSAYDATGNTSTQSISANATTQSVSSGGDIWSVLQTAGRTMNWSYTGVSGGIPNRTTICATLNPGASASAINSAINACTNGVVYLNAGTYNVTGIQLYKSNVTLRGAGADKTILAGAGIINLGNGYNSSLGTAITGGGIKGSSSFTVVSTNSLSVGLMIQLDRDNDPVLNSGKDSSRALTQVNMITAINGNTITVRNPLFQDFTTGNPKINFTFPSITQRSGIEDLKLEHNGATGPTNIQYCDQCWLKGVESGHASGYHFILLGTLNMEVRDSYIHEGAAGPNNSGLNFYGNYLYGTNSNAKIENNIFNKDFPAIEINNSSSGLYIGYNYSYGSPSQYGSNLVTWTFDDGHAPFNVMNLYEGNSAEMWGMDGYFGGSGYGILLRNYFSGYNPNYGVTGDAIQLKRLGYYYSFVGNVIGSTNQHSTAYDTGCSVPNIYQLGYPNIGNCDTTAYDSYSVAGGYPDAKVKSTLVRWGNYDYFNNALRFNASEIASGVAVPNTQTIPASFVYSSKPAWFPASTHWPLIGPDVTGGTADTAGKVYKSPAQLCWESLNLNGGGAFSASTCYGGTTTPPSDTTAPSVPTNLSATAVSSSGINLSWTASTDNVAVTGYNIYRGGTKIGTSATNSYSDTGLTASTAYTYTISAYDAASNTSSQSTSASATTQSVSSPSTKFTVGQRVQATPGTSSNLNVRATASATGTLLGTQPNGALGTIVSGGQSVGGYYWWNVNFDNAPDGYSVEDYLTPYATAIIGDFNHDGLVNSIDLSLLTTAWNTSNSTYDLNHDSIVNSLDYVIMVQNWSL